jgi:hypothetical protein
VFVVRPRVVLKLFFVKSKNFFCLLYGVAAETCKHVRRRRKRRRPGVTLQKKGFLSPVLSSVFYSFCRISAASCSFYSLMFYLFNLLSLD